MYIITKIKKKQF